MIFVNLEIRVVVCWLLVLGRSIAGFLGEAVQSDL